MASIWQLFPNVPNVEKKVQVYPLKGSFVAPLIGGKFTFEEAVQRVDLKEIFQGRKGMIAGVSFVSNIDQLIFSNAIDPSRNDGFFKMNVIASGNNHPVNLSPFYFASFAQADQFTSLFVPTATKKGSEMFVLSIDGALIQTPEIIALGKAEISLQAIINYYEFPNPMPM